MIELSKKIWRDHWVGITLISVGLLVYGWLFAALFPTFEKIDINQLIDQYPEALKSFLSESFDISTFAGFLDIEYFSLVWVIIVGGYLISFATSEISKEVETKTIESLLSLPISRFKIIFTKWLNMALITIFLIAISTFPLIGFAAIYGISLSAMSMLMISILGFLFFMSIGSFTMALAVLFNERNKAVFIPIVVLLFGYIWNSLGRFIESIENFRFFSIFYFFDSARALVDKQIGLASIFVFLGIIVISTAFAFYWFNRRDFAI